MPASFLPGGVPVLVLGLALLGWSVANDGGSLPLGLPSIVPTGPLLIPAAFLIGMALMRLRPSRRLLAPAFAVSALAGALLVVAWATTGDWTIYLAAAIAGAAAYSTGLLLALRPWLSALLEPLGRMALTNYVSGTLVIFLASPSARHRSDPLVGDRGDGRRRWPYRCCSAGGGWRATGTARLSGSGDA